MSNTRGKVAVHRSPDPCDPYEALLNILPNPSALSWEILLGEEYAFKAGDRLTIELHGADRYEYTVKQDRITDLLAVDGEPLEHIKPHDTRIKLTPEMLGLRPIGEPIQQAGEPLFADPLTEEQITEARRQFIAGMGLPTDTDPNTPFPILVSGKRFYVTGNDINEVCPDCRGTGEYVGLNHTEPCALCKGRTN